MPSSLTRIEQRAAWRKHDEAFAGHGRITAGLALVAAMGIGER